MQGLLVPLRGRSRLVRPRTFGDIDLGRLAWAIAWARRSGSQVVYGSDRTSLSSRQVAAKESRSSDGIVEFRLVIDLRTDSARGMEETR